MKIYTKTGDDGSTGTYGGTRMSKASLRMAAIGDVDELNACVGLALAANESHSRLNEIQNWLFDVGSELGMPLVAAGDTWISSRAIEVLETDMDEMTAKLPMLRNFILPGGSDFVARLHLARTVCRRAERAVIALNDVEAVRSELKVFLNRLSDWLFTAARFANAADGREDIAWRKTGVINK